MESVREHLIMLNSVHSLKLTNLFKLKQLKQILKNRKLVQITNGCFQNLGKPYVK